MPRAASTNGTKKQSKQKQKEEPLNEDECTPKNNRKSR